MQLSKEKKAELVLQSQNAMGFSYSPYSKYKVGCALLTSDGEVYTGSNIENASFGATICAERVAIFNAVSSAKKEFSAIVVATEKGWNPCGLCLQVMAEFCNDLMILTVDQNDKVVETSLKSLLPQAFTPKDF